MLFGEAFLMTPMTDAWRASIVMIERAAPSTAGSLMLKAWPAYACTPSFSRANDVLTNFFRDSLVPLKSNFGLAIAFLPRAAFRALTWAFSSRVVTLRNALVFGSFTNDFLLFAAVAPL